VRKLVFGSPSFTSLVGEKDGSTSHSENAVCHQLRSIVADVPIQSDVLHRNNDGIRIGIHLQQVLGEIDSYHTGTASHASQVQAHDVTPQFIVVDDHAGERWCGTKQAAIHNQDADVLGLHSCLLKQLIQCPVHHHLRFTTSFFHAGSGRQVLDSRWEVGFFSQS